MKTSTLSFGPWKYRQHYVDEGAEQFISEIEAYDGLIGLDIETAKTMPEHPMSGLCPIISRIRLVQFYFKGVAYVFDVFKVPLESLRRVLTTKKFVAHNGIFEIKHFAHNGFPNMNVGCSMLLSQMVMTAEVSPFEKDEGVDDSEDQNGLYEYSRQAGHSLEAVIGRLFNVKVDKTEQVSDWAGELSEAQINYAGLDAVLTYYAAVPLAKKVAEYKMEKAYTQLKQTQHVVAHMELAGMPVDWEHHSKLVDKWKTGLEEADIACAPFFGDTNVRSGKQMNAWLTEYLKDQPRVLKDWPRTDKGMYAFGKDVLAPYKHLPAINALLEYKKYAKLVDTYGESLAAKRHPTTGRLHTSYTLGETRTGRLSSRKPNIQNIGADKDFRNMFRADDGYALVVSDFSQIELRLQAVFSGDTVMNKVFRNKEDIYVEMAKGIYGSAFKPGDKAQRKVGKTCYSGDTEVLTPDGWVRLDEYKGQQVAQYALPAGCTVKTSVRQHVRSSRYSQAFKYIPYMGGGEVTFVTPMGYIHKSQQPVINTHDRNIDICATPDHLMYWVNITNSIVCRGEYQDMIKTKRVGVIVSGHMNKAHTLSENETRVLAMVVADGHTHKNGIEFGFVKRRKIRRCLELFSSIGIRARQRTYRSKATSTGYVTRIRLKYSEYPILRKFLSYVDDKKRLHRRCITEIPGRVYLEEAQFWDGHRLQREGCTAVKFTTVQKQTIDIMQAMAVTEGVHFTIHKNSRTYVCCYSLDSTYSRAMTIRTKQHSIQDVFCVEVPSGMLLLRRNNKVYVQGNCMLALGYGMGKKKLNDYALNAGVHEEQSFWDAAWKAYHNKFKVYSAWCDVIRKRATSQGFITTILGKRRKLLEDELYTRAPNTVIQGSAAELMMLALLKMYGMLLPGEQLLATVHDEVLLHVPQENAESASERLSLAMNSAMSEMFPQAVSHEVADAAYGERWGDIKSEL